MAKRKTKRVKMTLTVEADEKVGKELLKFIRSRSTLQRLIK